MEEKVRKVIRTKQGAILINLTGFLPNDWQYVFVKKIAETNNKITIEIWRVA